MKKQETKKEVKQIKYQACLLFDSDKICANCKHYEGPTCRKDGKVHGPYNYCSDFFSVR